MRNSILRFFQLESASGIVLFLAALLALIAANSPMASLYQAVWHVPFTLSIGIFSATHPLLFWINEGLMTLFFLVVGLELKRELIIGELATVSRIILPVVAAAGGMLLPVMIYFFLNYSSSIGMQGWAIPVATDIAFAMGVLSLFGRRVSVNLKLFLMSLAIFDDLGGIIIIAFNHTASLSIGWLLLALLSILILLLLNVSGVQRLPAYLTLGIVLWFCILKSGVHAILAGILLALIIPILTPKNKPPKNKKTSPLVKLESGLHFWVAYGVVPLFAFANAGMSLRGLSASLLFDPIVLGIAFGLFLGKQLGVFIFSWVLIQLRGIKVRHFIPWSELYGVSVLCGIGFTMSLFLGTLAYENEDSIYMISVRLGVLLGSVLSGVLGAFVLHLALPTAKDKGIGFG